MPPLFSETKDPVEPEIAQDLAPTGTLRAAINFGNTVLAQNDAATAEAEGVSIELARALGRRLETPVELVPFDAAGKVRCAQDGHVGHCLSGDRSCARHRDRVHGALRPDRGDVSRA